MRGFAIAVLLLVSLAGNAQNKLSGQRAYTLTKQYVEASGPRWVGSAGHVKAENFFRKFFAPEKAKSTLEEDAFSMSTPIGYTAMRNFIVKYPGKKDGIIVLCTHYETNYPLKDTGFVGANDGGATSGLLMEMAMYLRAHPPQGYSVWLVFDDGEEAIKNWTPTDSLYGTRHLAARWSGDGTLKKIKAFIVADMIGDKDLNLNYDHNSTPWMLETLRQAAKNTGHSASVFRNETEVSDDHLPFRERGVPVLDMIDIDYGPHTSTAPDGWHHTPQDTMDKVSARSLQISADMMLETVNLINKR